MVMLWLLASTLLLALTLLLLPLFTLVSLQLFVFATALVKERYEPKILCFVNETIGKDLLRLYTRAGLRRIMPNVVVTKAERTLYTAVWRRTSALSLRAFSRKVKLSYSTSLVVRILSLSTYTIHLIIWSHISPLVLFNACRSNKSRQRLRFSCWSFHLKSKITWNALQPR